MPRIEKDIFEVIKMDVGCTNISYYSEGLLRQKAIYYINTEDLTRFSF